LVIAGVDDVTAAASGRPRPRGPTTQPALRPGPTPTCRFLLLCRTNRK